MLSSFPEENKNIIKLSKAGDNRATEEIFGYFMPYIKMLANKYYIYGADKSDTIQEGMIGLFKAIRDFDFDKENSFAAFAKVCIVRHIKTALKAAIRKKHIPLNTSLSMNSSDYSEGYNDKNLDLNFKNRLNPETLVINDESYKDITKKLSDVLSEFEFRVLCLYFEGLSYREISKSLDTSLKSVDNAISRIKTKTKKIID